MFDWSQMGAQGPCDWWRNVSTRSSHVPAGAAKQPGRWRPEDRDGTSLGGPAGPGWLARHRPSETRVVDLVLASEQGSPHARARWVGRWQGGVSIDQLMYREGVDVKRVQALVKHDGLLARNVDSVDQCGGRYDSAS